ncbi:PilW family protein [Desulfurobacterium indicum]|uniref:Prepilin-type N-terminal cleavage/methylation domain-containing protein n=1 Tax=Desulfurobacterium indicum TaxID=1914305 RepID=A0A1R1MN41_9BACT|nr:hypothetical protein [Desulfurobacterium indicum]OMH41241.1 hypothetical protein BLW93_00805 [Desulfurobacterium indicum]
MRKALTLLELLVAIFAATLVMSAVYVVYTNLLGTYTQESSYQTSDIKRVLGLEILRQDIEHAGLGVGINETALPIEWNSTKAELTLRSLYDILDQKTSAWQIIDCSSSSANILVNKFFPGLSVTKAVYLSINGTIKSGLANYLTCPGNGTYIVYPAFITAAPSACFLQYCRGITYQILNVGVPDYCANGTGELVRGIKGTSQQDPILDCVADFDVRFDWDLNGDGIIEQNEKYLPISKIGTLSAAEERKRLKLVTVFVVVQQGKRNRKYKFVNQLKNNGVDFSNRVKAKVGKNWQQYDWRLIRFSVKPMDLM